MQDTDFQAVARRSVKSLFALTTRSFLIQIFGIFTSLALTVILDPKAFGVFFIVSSVMVFLNYFQDIGLAASLIQKRQEPSVEEFRLAFTVQQIFVLTVVLFGFLASGKIAQFYHLDYEGLYLFYSLLVSFFLSSLRTIPTVILERRLNFDKLVIPQILENFVYNASLITFALLGFGVNSFTIAVLSRGIVGLVSTYIIQPWQIGLSFDFKGLSTLLSFGVPFQLNTTLGLIKDDLLNIYIGKVLSFSQVGFVGFSQKLAYLPLRLVMDNVIRITFPSFSRLAHNKENLTIALEKSLFLVSSLVFPAVFGLTLLFPYITEFFPRYEKWEPAFLSVVIFALSTILSSTSTVLTNFLNSIGRVKTTLYFMIFWTISTWFLTVVLVRLFGFNGVALASFFVSLSSVGVFVVARRYARFSLSSVARPFLAALVMGAFIIITRGLILNLYLLFLEIILSGIFYFLSLFIIAREEVVVNARFVAKMLKYKEMQ